VVLYSPTSTGDNIKGLVLTWYDNNWGTVCDDVTNCDDSAGGGTTGCNGANVNAAGGKNLATVVCRSLGYTSGDEYNADDGTSSGYPIVVDGIHNYVTGCEGTEAQLSECSWLVYGSHNCQHFEDVGVTCTGAVEEPDSGACFHGDGALQLQSGATKKFSELSIGDVITTSNGQGVFSFSPVLSLPHKNNTEAAAFLSLTTETGKKVDMTSDHFIPKCDEQKITAGELVVGDCLITADGKEVLMEISSTAKAGVFTAITQDNFIVVNGIVASPFSKDSDPAKPELDYNKYRLELKEKQERKLAYRAIKYQELVQKTNTN